MAPPGAILRFQRLTRHGRGAARRCCATRPAAAALYAPVGVHRDLRAYWCAGCWRTAQPAPSASARRCTMSRWRRSARIRSRPPRGFGPLHTGHVRCRSCCSARAGAIPAAGTWPPPRSPPGRSDGAVSPHSLAGRADDRGNADQAVSLINPADARDEVGSVRNASAEQVAPRWMRPRQAFPAWQARAVGRAGGAAERAAEMYETEQRRLIALGRARSRARRAATPWPKCARPWMFLRYYAAEARATLALTQRAALGRSRAFHREFPLAIFTARWPRRWWRAIPCYQAGRTDAADGGARGVVVHAAGVPQDVPLLLPAPAIGSALR